MREFYANTTERTDGKSKVRGRLVSFDSIMINTLFGMRDLDDARFEALMEELNYDLILESLCHPGA